MDNATRIAAAKAKIAERAAQLKAEREARAAAQGKTVQSNDEFDSAKAIGTLIPKAKSWCDRVRVAYYEAEAKRLEA